MKDRLTRGFLAGIIATLPMNIWNYISYHFFHLTAMRLLDYASAMLFGKKVFLLWEIIFAQAAQFFFSGLIGVVFAYFIIRVSSRNYLFKSWFFSTTVWFTTFVIGTLYKIPYLYKVPTGTSLSNFIGTSIYGIVLALALRWLDDRVKS